MCLCATYQHMGFAVQQMICQYGALVDSNIQCTVSFLPGQAGIHEELPQYKPETCGALCRYTCIRQCTCLQGVAAAAAAATVIQAKRMLVPRAAMHLLLWWL